jgi:hypothetical protein
MCYVFDDILNSYFSLFKSINSEAIKVFSSREMKKKLKNLNKKIVALGNLLKVEMRKTGEFIFKQKGRIWQNLRKSQKKFQTKDFLFYQMFSHICARFVSVWPNQKVLVIWIDCQNWNFELCFLKSLLKGHTRVIFNLKNLSACNTFRWYMIRFHNSQV